MKLLTLEQLLQIHVFVVDTTGGGMGLRDIGRLESAIAPQTQNVFALLAGLTLLEINGVAFTSRVGEIEDYAVKIATDKLDIPAIALWLRGHIKD